MLNVCESSSEGRTIAPAKCCAPRDLPGPWANDDDDEEEDEEEDSFSPSPSLLGRKYSRVPLSGSSTNHLGCHPLTTLVNLLSCPAKGRRREEEEEDVLASPPPPPPPPPPPADADGVDASVVIAQEEKGRLRG